MKAGVALSPNPSALDAGIAALMGTARLPSGTPVGPWLEVEPIGDAYRIGLSNDGKGTVSVYTRTSNPSQVGGTHTPADCDLLVG